MPRRQSIPRKAKYQTDQKRVTDHFRAKLMRDGKQTLSDRILRQALARYVEERTPPDPKARSEGAFAYPELRVDYPGKRPIAAVRKRDLIELADAIVDRGAPIMANRVLAHTKRLFKWAAGRDLIESDPAVSPYLKVVMVENYNVTAAEKTGRIENDPTAGTQVRITADGRVEVLYFKQCSDGTWAWWDSPATIARRRAAMSG